MRARDDFTTARTDAILGLCPMLCFSTSTSCILNIDVSIFECDVFVLDIAVLYLTSTFDPRHRSSRTSTETVKGADHIRARGSAEGHRSKTDTVQCHSPSGIAMNPRARRRNDSLPARQRDKARGPMRRTRQ